MRRPTLTTKTCKVCSLWTNTNWLLPEIQTFWAFERVPRSGVGCPSHATMLMKGGNFQTTSQVHDKTETKTLKKDNKFLKNAKLQVKFENFHSGASINTQANWKQNCFYVKRLASYSNLEVKLKNWKRLMMNVAYESLTRAFEYSQLNPQKQMRIQPFMQWRTCSRAQTIARLHVHLWVQATHF